MSVEGFTPDPNVAELDQNLAHALDELRAADEYVLIVPDGDHLAVRAACSAAYMVAALVAVWSAALQLVTLAERPADDVGA